MDGCKAEIERDLHTEKQTHTVRKVRDVARLIQHVCNEKPKNTFQLQPTQEQRQTKPAAWVGVISAAGDLTNNSFFACG
jgi:hypothetical protein